MGLHMEQKNIKKMLVSIFVGIGAIPTYQLANIFKVSICHAVKRLGREGRQPLLLY
jgi:hypothetical protein